MTSAIVHGSAGLLDGLFLLAFLTSLVTARRWFLLKTHRRIVETQKFEPGGLTDIVARYLPLAHRTNVASEEIPLLQTAFDQKSRQYRNVFVAAAVAAVLLAPAAGIVTRRAVLHAEGRMREAALPPEVDPFKVAGGTWGWRFNALESCEENPHTITLLDMGRRVLIRFKQPIWNGTREISGYDGDVVGTRRNELMLLLTTVQTKAEQLQKPAEWSLVFRDRNTYYVRRSDAPKRSTADIVRCPEPALAK